MGSQGGKPGKMVYLSRAQINCGSRQARMCLNGGSGHGPGHGIEGGICVLEGVCADGEAKNHDGWVSKRGVAKSAPFLVF